MVVILGFLAGLVLVAPVGPVALTLFGLGAAQGRRAAIAGAGGVVLADLIIMPMALSGAGFLGSLDQGVVHRLEVFMGMALVMLAVVTILHAERTQDALGAIRHPTRALAAMTLLNPLSIVAWTGLALALPPSIRAPAALTAFGIGVVLASAVWHTGLAAASGSFAPRLGRRPRTVLTQLSGLVLLFVGGVLVV